RPRRQGASGHRSRTLSLSLPPTPARGMCPTAPREYSTLELARSHRRVSPGQATGIRRQSCGHGTEPVPNHRIACPDLGRPSGPLANDGPPLGQGRPKAAGRVLERLDTHCKSLVSTACLDEIFFHGHPVLVGVEPRSMTLIMAQKEDRLDRAAWVKNLVA